MDINSHNLKSQIQYVMFNGYFPLDGDYCIFWCSHVYTTLLLSPINCHVPAYPVLCYCKPGRLWPYCVRSQQPSFSASACLHTALLPITAGRLSFQSSKSPTKKYGLCYLHNGLNSPLSSGYECCLIQLCLIWNSMLHFFSELSSRCSTGAGGRF